MSMSSIFRKKSRTPLFELPALPSTLMPGVDDSSAPDTRMLSSLGGCVGTVSTVVEESLLPLSPTGPDFRRRQSTASAMSSASSAVLATPTYPSDPMWQQRKLSSSDSSHKQFEVVEGVESDDDTDCSAIRIKAPTPNGDADSISSQPSSASALMTTYQSDLFAPRNDEYDMSKLLAALGEDIQRDEQATVSPFGFETIGRGRDAKFFKDREVIVDTEDFYVPTFQTKHTTTGFRKHEPGTRFSGLREHLNATRAGGRIPPGPARPMRAIPEPR
ncbi:hypothetical protein CC85DRAFT_309983 [Cutaneotrichosporon oleaginosum]|uniref:Uncharacterized protein n=1 Tax=Cutaneotrichosporon oleaginosum TaxID=879819 RepID=A0A0J0XZ89_9TREE|nr:uncharacterized protein CC85DRAFT_309983 [Cutaneotrichosporon oleaginosum]KLT46361.1 hypothetical protein CC85DRAFT_309983 [Cutaneotrichosporon oleaginosum]TXT15268.1 hypothetical protein COLE_01461 [Cutaneotrichosporon oleaginosum]